MKRFTLIVSILLFSLLLVACGANTDVTSLSEIESAAPESAENTDAPVNESAEEAAEPRNLGIEPTLPRDQRAPLVGRECHLAEVILDRQTTAHDSIGHAVRRLERQHLLEHADAEVGDGANTPDPIRRRHSLAVECHRAEACPIGPRTVIRV
ncbi:MAG: hypothetical protein R3293_20285, partial [Candidatus Promineifilaceae bacterium]|nr:hypothetical protein [Candidatus Promineifilaceae bacterium]